MNPERWERIQTVFHEALHSVDSDRRALVEAACGDDQTLAADVLALLEEDARSASLLDGSLSHLAIQLLDPSRPVIPFPEFGPYKIKGTLGEGGMGVVYLAERREVQSLVAIKVLRDAWLSPARRDRFEVEQRMLAQLNHPAIARLYDLGVLPDGTPWFVMEYVKGMALTAYCRAHRSSLKERLRLFRAVCEAVQYAHAQAIIHRDLKPSNILVKEDGTLKLLDFGIAKQMESVAQPADQSQTVMRFMTPAYAAPEQVRGERVGTYTDVYSLGVILYELLTGQLPVDLSNLTPGEAENILLHYEPGKPSVVARKIVDSHEPQSRLADSKSDWNDLDVLCLTAMHKDAQRRYRSAEALIRDIDHFQKSEPLEARRDSLRYTAGKFIRRNQRAVLATSLGFLLTVGLVMFFTMRLAKERDRANEETRIATAMNRFLSDDILGQSDPFKSGVAKESFADTVNQAAPQIDLQFRTEPLVAARLHQTIAKAFDNRSDFPQARREYDRAEVLFRQGEGPLSADAVVASLQRAAMEARSNQGGSLAAAKSLLSKAEESISRTAQPRSDLGVWVLSTRGTIALVENEARAANGDFSEALRRTEGLSSFDQVARRRLKELLTYSYVHLGMGAKAEPLFREIIADCSRTAGPDSPDALQARLRLSQALFGQGKYAEAIDEENLIIPALVNRLGEDHEVTLAALTNRAAAEASLGMFDQSIRDDLKVHNLAVRKGGKVSFLSVASLSDAALAQCMAGYYVEGEANAREAFDQAKQAFGPRAGLTGGTSFSLAECLIGLNRFGEASELLNNIDVQTATEQSAESTVTASIALAQGEIAVRRGNYALAERYAAIASPAFEGPEADFASRRSLRRLRSAINSHLSASHE